MESKDLKERGLETSAQEAAKTAKAVRKLKRFQQRLFAGLLRQRYERGELIYDWSDTHRATTNMTGRADFWIAARGRFLQMEFKAGQGKLSPAQVKMQEHSAAAGVDYHVVWSASEANTLLVKWLSEL